MEMIILHTLTLIQFNILMGSIIGNGEITKIYENSRRRNHSYREHYGIAQEEYCKWKVTFLDHLLYITPKSCTVRSASLPLFSNLYPHFYNEHGTKVTSYLVIKFMRFTALVSDPLYG